MTKNVKVTHLRSKLSLEVDWVWGHQPTSHLASNDIWGRDTPKRLYKAPTDYTKPQNIRQTKTIRAPKGPGSGPPPHYQEYSQTPPNSSSRFEN